VHRVSKRDFKQLPLRVHETLAGVPLHDVWAIDLAHWSCRITLDQFLKKAPLRSIAVGPAASFLLQLRVTVGKVLGWDQRSDRVSAPTFSSRMTADDISSSLMTPGAPEGRFRVVYSFPNEHLVELANRTVHGALVIALVEGEDLYRLYLGVYVESVSWFTPLYMATIWPFRRWIVYPSILRSIRDTWNQSFGFGRKPARALWS
jgi:Protein of unknown function (DUF2867)